MSRAGNDNTFVFGISGHRDPVPADVPQLRQQLREIFQRSIAAHPGASFELLTPLAEGADRIAAHEALPLGIKLVVPMPMAQAEYERDFVSAGSLAEFRQLLNAAASKFELSDPVGAETGGGRPERYASVGEYIAQKSDLLILLWDGKENQKIGGTSWVRNRREHWSSQARQSGSARELATIHIPTRRAALAG